MKTVKEVYSINELEEKTKEAFEYLGEAEHYHMLEPLRFNSRLRASGARACRMKNSYSGAIVQQYIELNPKLNAEYIDLVLRHEALHLITGLGDNDLAFQDLLASYGIPAKLSKGMLKDARPYVIECPECGATTAYTRRGKYYKLVKAGDNRLSCRRCGSRELKAYKK